MSINLHEAMGVSKGSIDQVEGYILDVNECVAITTYEVISIGYDKRIAHRRLSVIEKLKGPNSSKD